MFEHLPIELENYIYRIYFSKNIINLINKLEPIYINMSSTLIKLINKDMFASDPFYFCNEKDLNIQFCRHTNTHLCLNCFSYGFRCLNCLCSYYKFRFTNSKDWYEYDRKIKNEKLQIYNSKILKLYNRCPKINHTNFLFEDSKKQLIKNFLLSENSEPEFQE